MRFEAFFGMFDTNNMLLIFLNTSRIPQKPTYFAWVEQLFTLDVNSA